MWNLVLKKIIEIKTEYINKFGNIDYKYKSGHTNDSESCLERWVSELNLPEYIDLLSCLEINQFNEFILIRYGRYSNIYDGEIENSGEDLWSRYDGFYRECRSIVVDIINDRIVLCPFSKFFNINELEETKLENIQNRINNAKCVEISDKLDGSMQSARWYNDKIIMAGSQAINPENSWRLQDGIRMLNENNNYISLLKDNPEYTFVFEYISLKDAHVVKYTKEQEGLYLIGIREVDTGIELTYHEVVSLANQYNILTTKVFDKTLDQVMNELDDKSSDEAEGFVINIDGYKVKVKYNDYVHIHKALSKLSSINLIIRSIADDKYDDLISKLPQAYHSNVNKVANIVFTYIKETEDKIKEYYNLAPKDDKKTFMIWVNKNVPGDYKGYVREMFLGSEINVIKSGNKYQPHYKKLNEMGIDKYSEIFV